MAINGGRLGMVISEMRPLFSFSYSFQLHVVLSSGIHTSRPALATITCKIPPFDCFLLIGDVGSSLVNL